jgi:hypothetical protein
MPQHLAVQRRALLRPGAHDAERRKPMDSLSPRLAVVDASVAVSSLTLAHVPLLTEKRSSRCVSLTLVLTYACNPPLGTKDNCKIEIECDVGMQ